jgi:uncharacterized membrane protein (UPF0127 family)
VSLAPPAAGPPRRRARLTATGMTLLARVAVSFGALTLVAACASDDGADPSAADPSAVDTTAVAGGSIPDDTSSATAATVEGTESVATEPVESPAGVQPDGFTTATVRITKADGEVCDVCMWLADDAVERGRGLMGVTDLGRPVGMAFVFAEPREGAFYMFGTPTPLSIAWFAPDGVFVSTSDMEPCTTEADSCERFFAAGEYKLAIEVFEGGLTGLGIGPGATAEVLAGTESSDCVVAS